MIRRATTADLRRLSRTGMRAFANDPLLRYLVPDNDDYEHGAGELLQRVVLRRWLEIGEVWAADDGVAFAAWCPPEPGPLPEDVAAELTGLRTGFSDQVVARFGVLAPTMQAYRPAEPHWYLNLLATHPDWHRQGYAAAVMADVTRRCDVDGIGQYLETATPQNVAYYRSRGFEVTDEWTVGGEVLLTGMWRFPGAGR